MLEGLTRCVIGPSQRPPARNARRRGATFSAFIGAVAKAAPESLRLVPKFASFMVYSKYKKAINELLFI